MTGAFPNLEQAARNRGYRNIGIEFCEEVERERDRGRYPSQFFAQECGLVGGYGSPAAQAALEYFRFMDGMRKLFAPL